MKLFLSMLIMVSALLSDIAQARIFSMQRLLSSQSMGASFASSEVDVSRFDLVSIQAVWTGGVPTGTFTIEVSNDDLSPSNWTTYPGSSIAVAAAGDLYYNVSDIGSKWMRLRYVRTGGTATLDAVLTKKLEGARE